MNKKLNILGIAITAGLIGSMPTRLAADTFTSDLIVNTSSPDIELNDTDANEADWEICVDNNGCNGGNGIDEGFHIASKDGGAQQIAIEIENRAGTSNTPLLYLSDTNKVGINTETPAEDLQIDSSAPGIRLNDTGVGAGQIDLEVETDKFSIVDGSNNPAIVVELLAGGGTIRDNQLYLAMDGRIGLGTTTPSQELTFASKQDDIQFGSDGNNWTIESGSDFLFQDNDGTDVTPFKIGHDAPTNSLTIEPNTGDIGIGKGNPAEAVDVQRSGSPARFQLTSYSSTGSNAAQFVQRRARGSSASPTAPAAFDNLGLFSFRGYNGTSFTGTKAGITVQTTEAWNAGGNGTRMLFQTTRNGTTALNTVMEITHDGKVKIGGTQLNVPDYVFAEDYKLMPLDELRAYLKEHKHLPNIASESEVKAEGVDLGGGQMALLEKVEELTLYTLQLHEAQKIKDEKISRQDKKIDSQARELARLKEKMASLESQNDRVAKLEKMMQTLKASGQVAQVGR